MSTSESRVPAIGLLAALLSTGCFKIDYVTGPSAPYPQTDEWHHIGILGLVEFSEPVRLDTICPGGFARVHNEVSPLNLLASTALGLFTATAGFWVYQPHTVQVYCKSGQAYDVQLDGDGMATAATRLPDVEPTADAEAPAQPAAE